MLLDYQKAISMFRSNFVKQFFILFFILVIHFGTRSFLLFKWQKYKNYFYYKGSPIPVTMDAFYYMRLSKDLSKDGRISTLRVFRLPFIALLGAYLEKSTKLSLEKIAFYLPGILSIFSSFAVYYLGYSLKDEMLGLLTFLIFNSFVLWLTRSGFGWFDTDPLNPFFFTIL